MKTEPSPKPKVAARPRTAAKPNTAWKSSPPATTSERKRNLTELLIFNSTDSVVEALETVGIKNARTASVTGTHVNHGALSKAGGLLRAGTVAYAIARIPSSVQSLGIGAKAYFDPNLPRSRRMAAYNQALDTLTVNASALSTSIVLFQESNPVVRPVAKTAARVSAAAKAAAKGLASKTTPAVVLRVTKAAGLGVETRAGASVAQRLAGGIVPGLAVGFAVNDGVIATNTLNDPKANAPSKVGAVTTAVGSGMVAVGTVLMYTPAAPIGVATSLIGTGISLTGTVVSAFGSGKADDR